MKEEAIITVNGRKLTEAQSCAVRVAINRFRCDLPKRNLGVIGPAYDVRLAEVEEMIFNPS